MSSEDRYADHLAIMDVLVRYAVSLDTRDWQRLRSCFAKDVRVSYPPDVELTGPDATADFCERALAPYSVTQHLLGTHQIEIEGDRARARTYLHATHIYAHGEVYVLGGTYTDELERHPEGWRIARRSLTSDWTERRPTLEAKTV